MPKKQDQSNRPFGERLAVLRKEAGLTQAQLSQQIGISQRMLSHYEHCSEYPYSGVLCDLSKVLGVSADELLGLTQPPKLTKAAKPKNTK